MSEQSDRDGKSKRSIWDWSAMIAVLGAIGTISMYLVARSYHDGYLKGLGLSSSMFPISPGDVSVLATVAIFKSIMFVFNKVFGAGLWGWAKAVAIVFVVIFGWGLLNFFENRAAEGARNVSGRFRKIGGWLIHPVALHWTKPALGAIAVFYLVFCSLFAVAIVIFLLIWPFFTVGKDFAAEEVGNGFRDSPSVTLKNPDGVDEKFRLIQCSTQFCAFFSDGKVVAAPMSDMKWVVSIPQSANR